MIFGSRGASLPYRRLIETPWRLQNKGMKHAPKTRPRPGVGHVDRIASRQCGGGRRRRWRRRIARRLPTAAHRTRTVRVRRPELLLVWQWLARSRILLLRIRLPHRPRLGRRHRLEQLGRRRLARRRWRGGWHGGGWHGGGGGWHGGGGGWHGGGGVAAAVAGTVAAAVFTAAAAAFMAAVFTAVVVVVVVDAESPHLA